MTAVDLHRAVSELVEPQLVRPLGELGFVGAVEDAAGHPVVELILPVTNWPHLETLRARVEALAEGVEVRVRTMDDAGRLALRNYLRGSMAGADGDNGDGHGHGAEAPAAPRFLARDATTRVLGISSGKGGVGKSSVSVNLAIALAAQGYGVGLLDADVYGFSLPKMLGAASDPIVLGDIVIPTLVHGVRCLSMGYFVDDDQPVIWRGPMLHKAIGQLVTEAWWDEPDFLVVDMPPGTGDVALTLSEVVPRVEMYVVTTPQAAAQRVAQRSALAARKLKLAVRGVIENMSWFAGDDGVRYAIFGEGGGASLAASLGVPLLGAIPLEPRLREGGDVGSPVVVAAPETDAARAFVELATRIAAQGPARVYRQELRLV
ncbi:MAG TPA: Mrp/NBP35 family ATP-binding protein [Acidimicrobiales bacterium]|nr:Mrp/NBP35 family ATP-binding protein [Acidimicrobiales bacterium]